jgi:hypothetical protein
MKKIQILILCLIVNKVFSQEIPVREIKTEVNEVTVFIESAQITSRKTIELVKGTTILKFTNLSPFIDPKSIQVKANGEITVLSVNHQQNFMDKVEKPLVLNELESKLKIINDKIKLENTYLGISSEELAFIQENRNLGGKDQAVNAVNLKEASAFYSSRITTIKLDEIAHNKNISDLNTQRDDIQNQMNTLTNKKDFPTGEILVKVDAKVSSLFKFEISYLVANAGWFPSYDIRAKNINEPVEIIYKANVRQDTKVDWNDVKIRFSSSDPNVSGIAPKLETYYLNYNSLPPIYNNTSNEIKGRVCDMNQNPLPGVTVSIQGTTIGTTSDLNGVYSITIPQGATNLEFSYVGYSKKIVPANSKVINVALSEDLQALDEVVVIGYGTQKKKDITGAIQSITPGVSVQNSDNVRIRGVNSISIPSGQVVNQTTVDFEINTPFTVKSDNKSYAVDMAVYNLPADFQYYCVPKIDKSAFLMANIIDWEKYNLLEGEANIFFEDTYIGKTLLDVRYATDTLQVSLGKDKSINVNREKVKDYSTKQFLGNKKIETRVWTTTIKKNKNQKINLLIFDQIPVSTNEEIKVDAQNVSGGELDPVNGEVKWKFTLEPNDKKEVELKYSVSYPKNNNLKIE